MAISYIISDGYSSVTACRPIAHALPDRFVNVLRVLMHKSDAEAHDPDRILALEALNKPLSREGFEAFYPIFITLKI